MQLCGAYWGTHGNVSEQTPIYRVVHGNMHALGQAYRLHKRVDYWFVKILLSYRDTFKIVKD
jgi:hypothetical protein